MLTSYFLQFVVQCKENPTYHFLLSQRSCFFRNSKYIQKSLILKITFVIPACSVSQRQTCMHHFLMHKSLQNAAIRFKTKTHAFISSCIIHQGMKRKANLRSMLQQTARENSNIIPYIQLYFEQIKKGMHANHHC